MRRTKANHFTQHALHALVDDHSKFIRIRRVVGDTVGHSGCDQMTAAILMLQAFAAQRSATRGGTDQEAARSLISRCPNQITDALETKHRVVDVEGQHGQTMHRITRGCGRP